MTCDQLRVIIINYRSAVYAQQNKKMQWIEDKDNDKN